ncbi:MAG: transposase [Ktedonobacterales bacterium]|nr:transposase [Ktedonobacterales bacterium]
MVIADQGYTGAATAEAMAAHGMQLQIVTRSEAMRGFVLLPRRWVVERSFAWLARFSMLHHTLLHNLDTYFRTLH